MGLINVVSKIQDFELFHCAIDSCKPVSLVGASEVLGNEESNPCQSAKLPTGV